MFRNNNNTLLKIGSLFDGIGVFPLAASLYGIKPVWASEVEKAPVSITKRHFPTMLHLGDITKIDGGKIPPVHINYVWFALSKLIQYRKTRRSYRK
ncbi:DNA cytosine methyltransferase [Oceanobacillus jeddahense]|uniref:DNA cytosine methyltransferase n=1 Tax=Oceanobacillus jeddahense TaxID=1462527 RepID=UPI0021CBB6E1|nr:DNA cytosine methyltransferase [Oceanobacillus jeddahense]